MEHNEPSIMNSTDQIEQISAVFGSQANLANAIGVPPRNVSEWKRQALGIPTKFHRKIWYAAKNLGKEDDLPWWFPRYLDAPQDEKVPA